MTAPRIHLVEPVEGHSHSHTVILLHGRDSNASEFASEFFECEASQHGHPPQTLQEILPSFRWVFPSAPMLQSARFSCDLSQWFDMWSVENPDERPELQAKGLVDSVKFVLEIIKEEEARVPMDRIILGGISQGFATAIAAFLGRGRGMAALVGMCTWMPLGSATHSMQSRPADEIFRDLQRHLGTKGDELNIAAMRSTPAFLSHNSDDDVVPVENGQELRRILESQLGLAVEWHQYEHGGHWIHEPQGVNDLVSFLNNTLS